MVRINELKRKTLKQIGGLLGTSTFGVVESFDFDNYEGEDGVEIVVAWEGDEPAITRRVSEDWLHNTQRARDVKDSLKWLVEEIPGIHSIGVEAGEDRIGGLLEQRVVVKYDPEIRPKDKRRIPDVKDGIQIRSKERKRDWWDFHACGSDEYDSVYPTLKAGIEIGSEYADSVDGEWGTLHTEVEQEDWVGTSKYMLTARHLFVDSLDSEGCPDSSVDVEGQPVDDSGNNQIGTVDQAYPKHDLAFVDVGGDETSEVVDAGGTIKGVMSKSGIGSILSSPQEFRGKTSGNQTHTPTDYDEFVSCGSYSIDDVVISDASDGPCKGDSGGILFHEADSDNYYAIGMHFGGDSQSNQGFSVACYAIESEYDCTFST